MVQKKRSSQARLLPKMWVVHLLCQFEAEVWQLNAQLTLPRGNSRPFVFGSNPPPLRKGLAPQAFEQALERGNDPDRFPHREPLDSAEQGYNLFLRVAEYVPYSEDWLFTQLEPYLRPQLPNVNASSALIATLLERLGLRRLGSGAVAFGMAEAPALVVTREREGLKAIARCADPIHLLLLLAIYHERQWHWPCSEGARAADRACCEAIQSFCNRPEFTCSEWGRAIQTHVEGMLRDVVLAIRHDGHHSAPPVQPGGDGCATWFNHDPLLLPTMARRCLIYAPFPGAGDAELCARLGHNLPIAHLLEPVPNRFSRDCIPERSESAAALHRILVATELSPERLRTFERDPAIMARLSATH